MGGPPPTCMGFYPTNRNAQTMGAHVLPDSSLTCSDKVGGNVFGWCSCSDSVPRFVNVGDATTTCNDKCASTPAYYVSSDIPALTGQATSNSVTEISEWRESRLSKLSAGMGAFLVGCGLLVFHILNEHGSEVSGERALMQLVKATGVKPSQGGNP